MSNAPKPGATGATNPTNPPTSSTAQADRSEFERSYASLLKHLRLKGMQPKTIEAYAHGIRRLGERFDWRIGALTDEQLTDHFSQLLQTHSWSSVKHDLYGYKFYCAHVLGRPWAGNPGLIKPPKVQRLPDIVTVEQAARLFAATRCLSYRVFFFTLYSLGLRLGEALALQVGDIDAARMRVHVRDAKGNRDRLVPLAPATLDVLRRFWGVHRNPTLLFPGRAGGVAGAARAERALDRAGVQRALREVVRSMGLKKTFTPTACATAMPRT